MENRPRYRVPDELRELLLDFTIAYLLERPNNLADFGLNFFTRLRGDRMTPRENTVQFESNEVEIKGQDAGPSTRFKVDSIDSDVIEIIPLHTVDTSIMDTRVPTGDFIRQHAVPVESEFSTIGLHIHINPGIQEIKTLGDHVGPSIAAFDTLGRDREQQQT